MCVDVPNIADAATIATAPDSPKPQRTAHAIKWVDPNRVREPDVAISPLWFAMQLIPSPELGFGSEGSVFGLRWQVTPLLYSFGIDPRLRPWRFLIAEPLVRHSGSVELFLSPEYLTIADELGKRFGLRGGVRAYFPLIERGDALSISLASSYFRFREAKGVTYSAGAYVLFGFIGFELGYSPGFDQVSWLGTIRLRYF